MARTSVIEVAIQGISSVLPAQEYDNSLFHQELDVTAQLRVMDSTGIKKRRVVPLGQTCLDLAKIGSKNFFEELNWQPSDIGLLIFVTQTPDYPFPGNAVQMQHYLGLDKSTIALDINLGCSGFVYGLWQTSQLLSSIDSKRALLIVGDTTSTQYSSANHAVSALFGDAVSLIALEKDSSADTMVFDLGTDGAGAPYLMQPNGGARYPLLPPQLFMDGTQVFTFTLREIPHSVLACLADKKWTIKDVDFSVMHQANEMMLKHLGAKIGFSEQQMVISMGDIGNTSSASIPLAMCLNLAGPLQAKKNKLLLSGFGVGWSWGTVAYEQAPLKICRVIDLHKSPP